MVPNAGVMLVGSSAQHGAVPAALLGGRWYTTKKVYVYTDFGGGVEWEETPQQGAFREFAEELLGQSEEVAKATASNLCATAGLVYRSFLHKGYAMYIIHAQAVVETLNLSPVAEGMSAIDHLFSVAKWNSELTSVALVSLEELLKGGFSDGCVHPLSVRHLDGQDRSTTEIHLRQLMVGPGGSIATLGDALKTFQAGVKCKAPMPYVFDMETGDPDDVLTLLFLGSNPEIELRAVTVTPGSHEQVALVRWLLQQIGLPHVRLGAQDWPNNSNKPVNLGGRFYMNFGRVPDGEPRCERADQVLLACCDDDVTLVTGAALHNLGEALKLDGFRLGRWVAQGGFAGEGVVPRHLQMDKFKGMETCPTYNFCGNITAAQAALASSAIKRKICVSKNVCHSVTYDEVFHASLCTAVGLSPQGSRAVAFQLIYRAMDDYLKHKPGGKKLHDPLALAVAIDESVCKLVEVELYCQKGQWGSRLCPDSNIWISISYDAGKFVSALLH